MPEEITVKVPTKLIEFIDKLTKDGYFNSREDFARCSVEIIAQLYGLSTTSSKGKSLLDILVDNGKIAQETTAKPTKKSPATNIKTSPKPVAAIKAVQEEALSTEEMDLLDLFIGSKFEFEDALHAKYTMELMKLAKAPLPKSDFIKLLESLANKGKIEKSTHNKKTVWKVLERY